MHPLRSAENIKGTFVDLFAGCGGFSLGIAAAGWRGIFAIEKDKMAFETFQKNLLLGEKNVFDWPIWLPQENLDINDLIKSKKDGLISLQGRVDLIVGGPPCQGFSLVGRRNPNDPRNNLFRRYLDVVDAIRPRFLLMENVNGFDIPFVDDKSGKELLYSKALSDELAKLGYATFSQRIKSCDWGVPQLRPRFIMLAVKSNEDCLNSVTHETLPAHLERHRKSFLASKGLSHSTYVKVGEAIGDLEISRNGLIPYKGRYGGKGFMQIDYSPPQKMSPYLQVLRDGCGDHVPNSLRLARHRPATVEKFKRIQDNCEKGRSVPKKKRQELGMRKQAIFLLSEAKPSGTLTTLPDDIVHYSEPRAPTVREMARLQSFPDWFSFHGKYTTGGKDRVKECPRFTQVGNAVPPLLAEALGSFVAKLSGNIDP